MLDRFAASDRLLGQRDKARRAAAVASVVVAARNARRHRRRDEIVRHRQHGGTDRNAQWAGGIVRAGVDDDVAGWRQPLALAEVGQHVDVAPAGGAAFGPGVEVAGMTADIHHVVDAGRSAEHFAARHWHTTEFESQTGFFAGISGVHPVDVGIELHRGAGERHRRHFGRPFAGLDQRHAAGRVFR